MHAQCRKKLSVSSDATNDDMSGDEDSVNNSYTSFSPSSSRLSTRTSFLTPLPFKGSSLLLSSRRGGNKQPAMSPFGSSTSPFGSSTSSFIDTSKRRSSGTFSAIQSNFQKLLATSQIPTDDDDSSDDVSDADLGYNRNNNGNNGNNNSNNNSNTASSNRTEDGGNNKPSTLPSNAPKVTDDEFEYF